MDQPEAIRESIERFENLTVEELVARLEGLEKELKTLQNSNVHHIQIAQAEALIQQTCARIDELTGMKG